MSSGRVVGMSAVRKLRSDGRALLCLSLIPILFGSVVTGSRGTPEGLNVLLGVLGIAVGIVMILCGILAKLLATHAEACAEEGFGD